MSSNDVFALAEDREGYLWIGSRGGLVDKYDRHEESFSRHKIPGQEEFPVEAIVEDAMGNIWVGMLGGGFYKFDRRNSSFIRIDLIPDVDAEGVTALHKDRDNILWLGVSNASLVRFNPQTDSIKIYEDFDELSGGLEDIIEDDEGNILLARAGAGVALFDKKSGTSITYSPNQEGKDDNFSNYVYRFYKDSNGTIWAGFYGGVFNQIAGLFADGGLFKVSVEPHHFFFHPFDTTNTLGFWGSKTVTDFYEDPDGKLWISTIGSGLLQYDPLTEAFTRFDIQSINFQTRQYNAITQILERPNGVIWISGIMKGLMQFDTQTRSFLPDPFHFEALNKMMPWGPIRLFEDHQEIIWLGTGRSGLIRLNPQTGDIQQFQHDSDDPNTLLENTVLGITEDHKQRLWITTYPGNVDYRKGTLHRLDLSSESFERYQTFDAGLSFITRDGDHWVGSQTMGLFSWDPDADAYTRYTVEDGLSSSVIGCFVEDQEGNIWASTLPHGLMRIDKTTGAMQHFDISGELSDSKLTAGQGACYRMKSGKLYFGALKGFVSFDPDSFLFDQTPPRVVLTDFLVRGFSLQYGDSLALKKPIHVALNVQLQHMDNDFAIQYAGLHFDNPSQNTYRYILEGYNDQWVDAGTNRIARFSQVKPGDYTFTVLASNANRIWSKEGASLAIKILPPWWRTIWAYISYALIFSALVYWANRQQRNRLIEREREQKKLEIAQLEKESVANRVRMAEELERVKTNFFVNITHEFRTPLTLILGPLKDLLVGMHGDIESRLKNQLQIMQRSGNRLLVLINQLLDIEKLDVGGLRLEASENDLVAFTKALTLTYDSRAMREKKHLVFSSSISTAKVYYDTEKLEKVLHNLLSNAFNFTSDGDEILLTVSQSNEKAFITVRDSGEGISEEQQKLIFNRFHQVDSSSTRLYEGSGIGLALAKELIALHKGDLEVSSNLGTGTTFTITLALGVAHLNEDEIVASKETDPLDVLVGLLEKSERTGAAFDLQKTTQLESKILLVEDNPDLRQYLKSHLDTYEIIEAANGEEGLQAAIDSLPDLIISDVMMPRMDGISLCEALRKDHRTQNIPFILLTAKAVEESKLEGLKAGADDYLYKPFSAKELQIRTQNLIDRRLLLKERYKKTIILKPAEVEVSSEDELFVEKIRTIVDDQMGDSWFGVERLAGELGMSRRHLQRRMNAILRIPASTFIADMRLERALQLLKQRVGNVSEVAYKVGYNDPKHFSKLFKRRFGYSPSETLKDDKTS